MKYKYLAYYAADNEVDFFETFEEAKKWLIEWDEQDGYEDGYTQESVEGGNYIARITHKSSYEIIDRQADYHVHTDSCTDDCQEEEWPYNTDYDTVGKIKYIPIDQSGGKE